MNYDLDYPTYRRRPTREVRVGDVGIGGGNPIRVQSMTTPRTTETEATVEQIVRLVEAGCEIVRLTVPSTRDADNLPNIRAELRRRGVSVPLVADIHFTPAAAMKAAEHVDKVRINPGNFADSKKFAVLEYTDDDYAAELRRIEETFTPLVLRCRKLGIAMRIGTNHGSLSDRIMNRYGDTPEGMVESALEFVRICESHSYHDIVLSMKASNPVVVLQAYRHLVDRMDECGMAYPLHLGVTEAGGGEDARIKSAIGIGALLEDGIGDTVRVSLTEDPVAEIPVARKLVARFNAMQSEPLTSKIEPVAYTRRESDGVAAGPVRIGGGATVAVELPVAADIQAIETGFGNDEDAVPEIACIDLRSPDEIETVRTVRESLARNRPGAALSVRLDDAALLHESASSCDRIHWTVRDREESLDPVLDACSDSDVALLVESACGNDAAVAAASLAAERGFEKLMLAAGPGAGESPLLAGRRLARSLAEKNLPVPLVLIDRPLVRGADRLLAPSSALGGLLCEGIGDAVHVALDRPERSRELAFGILQASRVRITRTEFISCPSCGRTLFDLESTTDRIRSRTSHLKGVKIAIMGCIVNGPGEMADADFGYVGWGKGKIALFVGREMVEKNIPAEEADGRLIELIRRHGRWIDPPVRSGP